MSSLVNALISTRLASVHVRDDAQPPLRLPRYLSWLKSLRNDAKNILLAKAVNDGMRNCAHQSNVTCPQHMASSLCSDLSASSWTQEDGQPGAQERLTAAIHKPDLTSDHLSTQVPCKLYVLWPVAVAAATKHSYSFYRRLVCAWGHCSCTKFVPDTRLKHKTTSSKSAGHLLHYSVKLHSVI